LPKEFLDNFKRQLENIFIEKTIFYYILKSQLKIFIIIISILLFSYFPFLILYFIFIHFNQFNILEMNIIIIFASIVIVKALDKD
jgi:hypothetical protein